MVKARAAVKRSNLCAVAWCAAFATVGDYCPVHAKHPDLHPEYLAADEEAVESIYQCTECAGTGDCKQCRGTGEHRAYCFDCRDTCSHECRKCNGGGNCASCDGEGTVTHRKKATA